MKKNTCFAMALLVGMLIASCNGSGDSPHIRQVTVSSTIEIPVQLMNTDSEEMEPSKLTVTSGGEDELPQGPVSFDVLPDGGFVISDPLQRRLAYFDASGKYLRQEIPEFYPGSVRYAANQTRVSRLYSDETFELTTAGEFSPVASMSAKPEMTVRRLDDASGIITGPAAMNSKADTLKISFESAGEMLVSLQSLGADSKGNRYVALEVSSGGDPIEIRKIIREYNSSGNAIAQIEDISLDQYVAPIDPFRVAAGQVYQMSVQETKVLIHVWDMN